MILKNESQLEKPSSILGSKSMPNTKSLKKDLLQKLLAILRISEKSKN